MTPGLHDTHGPGLHTDITEDQYHQRRLGVATSSGLRVMVRQGPAHLRHWYDTESEDTAALRFGRLAHTAVLEADVYAQRYVELPTEPDFGDCRRKGPKAERDAWRARHWPGDEDPRDRVSGDDAARIQGIRAALAANAWTRELLEQRSYREATILWQDEETGVKCQARPDLYIPGQLIADLKTTADCSPQEFRGSIARYDYHLQAAHYEAAARSLGDDVPFVILAAEKAPPHGVAIYRLDDASIEQGNHERQRALRTMRQCISSGVWPARTTGMTEIGLPPWRFWSTSED